MIQFLLVFSDWGILFLRIALSLILIERGFLGFFKTKNKKPFSGWKKLSVLTSSFLNFFAGFLIFVGLFTQIFSALIALKFLFVLLPVPGRLLTEKKTEAEFLILASSVLFVALGGGAYSLDSFFNIRIY